jgi:hypothetical protein
MSFWEDNFLALFLKSFIMRLILTYPLSYNLKYYRGIILQRVLGSNYLMKQG